MKIVHYLWSAQIGGIERLVLDLATTQQNQDDLTVTVLFGNGQGALLNQFRTNEIQFEICGLQSGFDFSPNKLINLIKFFKQFDLLHLHGFHPLVALTSILSGKKIIYTEHGTFGIGRHLNTRDRLKKILKQIFLNKWVNFITFNSEYTRAVSRQLYGLRNRPQAVVYNGTTLTEVALVSTGVDPAILEQIKGKFIIGTTSRFVHKKRVDRLIEGFASFHKGKDTILLLVGDGPSKQELETMATSLCLNQVVIFTGFRSNVTEYQKLMDVCVFPAEREPFGLVAIETLALGKPTIVFKDGGGLTEIINGLEPLDIVVDLSALINRLDFYYSQNDITHTFSKERKAYVKKFSIERMADDLDNIYHQVTR